MFQKINAGGSFAEQRCPSIERPSHAGSSFTAADVVREAGLVPADSESTRAILSGQNQGFVTLSLSEKIPGRGVELPTHPLRMSIDLSKSGNLVEPRGRGNLFVTFNASEFELRGIGTNEEGCVNRTLLLLDRPLSQITPSKIERLHDDEENFRPVDSIEGIYNLDDKLCDYIAMQCMQCGDMLGRFASGRELISSGLHEHLGEIILDEARHDGRVYSLPPTSPVFTLL